MSDSVTNKLHLSPGRPQHLNSAMLAFLRSGCTRQGCYRLLSAILLLVCSVCVCVVLGGSVTPSASLQVSSSSKVLAAPSTGRPIFTPSEPSNMQDYFASDSLGVSRCSLPVVLDNRDALLHIWTRFVPGWAVQPSAACQKEAAAGTQSEACSQRPARLRGFILLQDRNSVPSHGPQHSEAPQLKQASDLVTHLPSTLILRSGVSGNEYPVTIIQHMMVSGHVIDILEEFHPKPEDQELLDWELRIPGVEWYCLVLGKPPVITASWTQQQQQPQPVAQPAAADATQQQAGAAAGPKPWTHVTHSSLSDNTQVTFLMSPYQGISVEHYATLLWYHVLWHAPLGVHHYIMYVTERVTELVSNKLIQELQRQGILQVVMYVDMPKHDFGLPASGKAVRIDRYLLQAVVYNHALLSLWGTDSLVLVADLDEYLTTAKPMSAVQAFKQCGQPSELQGVLVISRVDAMCWPPLAASKKCSDRGHVNSWQGITPQQIASGAVAHPLSMLTGTSGGPTTSLERFNFKTLGDPNLILDLHIHHCKSVPGSTKGLAGKDCAIVLHLVNLFQKRGSTEAAMTDQWRQEWWWPVDALMNSGQQASKAQAGDWRQQLSAAVNASRLQRA